MVVSYWICQQYLNIYFQEDRPIPDPGVGGKLLFINMLLMILCEMDHCLRYTKPVNIIPTL